MKVLVTGSSSGIGYATVCKFLSEGWEVYGIDIKPSPFIARPTKYKHFICSVTEPHQFPKIEVDVIINNAGTINEARAIKVNLEGYINIVEKYATSRVKSIVNVGSISGHVGLDSARYSASQGGRLAYTKHLANELGKKYGTRVNSISPGAVLTGLEPELYSDKKLVKAVAKENILNKWIKPEEIAEWIYFVAVIDKSMTGQDVLIDNGEVANYNFIASGERK